jgi:hypothetical protein
VLLDKHTRRIRIITMKSTPLLAGLLAAAMLLADLVVIRRWPAAPDASLLLFGGLAAGQIALVAMWSLWGTAPWLLRLLAPAALAAWLSLPLAAATAGRWPEWFLVLTLFAGLVALPLGCLFRGEKRSAGQRDTRRKPGTAAGGRLQFSLGGLLSWMTLIAVACALRDKFAFPWAYGREVAVYGVCLAAVAVGALRTSAWWTSESPGSMYARVAGLTLVCLVSGWFMHATTGVRNVSFYTLLALIEAIVICIGLSVCVAANGPETS